MAEPVERQKTGGPVHTDFPFFCVAPFGIRAACRQGGGPPEPCRENRACQRPMMFHQTMPTVDAARAMANSGARVRGRRTTRRLEDGARIMICCLYLTVHMVKAR